MKKEYDSCTEDKNKLSYSMLVNLVKLGFNPAIKGTVFFKDVIVYICENDLEFFTIKEICKILSRKYSISEINIYKSIVYAVQSINYNLKVSKDIFNANRFL